MSRCKDCHSHQVAGRQATAGNLNRLCLRSVLSICTTPPLPGSSLMGSQMRTERAYWVGKAVWLARTATNGMSCILWSSGWPGLERPSSFTAPRSEFTQDVSTKGLIAELRVPVVGSLGITFHVCDVGVKRSSDPCVTPTPTGQTVWCWWRSQRRLPRGS